MKFILLTLSLLSITTLAQAQPFPAWISTREDVWVQQERGESVGLLRYGDRVMVARCEPDCVGRSSWMYLAPYGRIRRLWMDVEEPSPEAAFLAGSVHNFLYAKVLHSLEGTNIRRNDEIIIRNNQNLLNEGFIELPDQTRFPASYFSVFTAPTFRGWVMPPNKFAFVISNTEMIHSDATWETVSRYDRFLVRNVVGRHVVTPTGNLDRSKVRVGHAIPRPNEVPTGAQWVHVNLDEQVLTAYEGDRLVYATLVSTGRRNNSTHRGTFRVRRKVIHTHMRGGGRRPYSVEGVTFVQYLDGINESVALHAAFWHDNFGTRRSHGCINLSPYDAEFLYRWSLPDVPVGWRGVHPLTATGNSLWVVIE